MAKKKLISEVERTKIAIAYNQYRGEKAEFIRQVASELCGRELGLSTVQRELAKLRREHPRGSTDPIDNQWSLASLREYPVSAQAVPFLLYIQYTWEDNIPDAFKEYKKRKGEKISSTLTNRLALWISRLMPLLGTDPRATEDEDNKIWIPQDVSQKNLNKWPAWIDDFVHIAGAYASYEIGCELAGVKPINTIYYDAPTLEQIKLNIIMYNKPFLESKKPETVDEKFERFESIKVEDIVRKRSKQNARSHSKKR